ncbi:histone-lysine N-methyltransferase SETMAR [Trichonephila clavipes]|nr:histone-lysine N-methyltransferase SETMAR [Trichonephila clavipes]GFU36251.1 histone-lysine N-methyltransferase SETMAR [Trichonephila clavipes]
MCDQATEAGGLVPPLQSLTKLASLRRLFLAQQPLAMELPLASPASCELRSVIRFLAAKKKSAKEIHEELCQVYGEECMSSGMVRRWVRDFKNGRTDVHDEARAGRPSASDETIAKVEAAMLEDRRTTVRELCEKIPEVSKTTIDKILTEHLGYSKVCARWVPKMLTADHKRQRVEAAQEFLAFHGTTEEEFLDSIVTGDETWVHYTTPETKEQSKQWKHPSSPRAKKFKQILSAGKIMASIFGIERAYCCASLCLAGQQSMLTGTVRP